MASVYVHEVDGTIYGLSTTAADNIVFVPGNAITGPSEPTLCTSYVDFTNKFGDQSPTGDNDSVGTSWDYAANILLAGFPVLFRRITHEYSASGEGAALVSKAQANINYTDSQNVEHNIGYVTEKYGGTFGNSLKYMIVVNDLSIYFRLYKTYKIGTTEQYRQIESIKLIDKQSTDAPDSDNVRDALLARIGDGLETDYVIITVNPLEEENFRIQDGGIKETSLEGGADASDNDILRVVPFVYSELEDKLIYDVKFVTGGGYCDATAPQEAGGGKILVSQNMVKLADDRQDCIAFPDIPLGLDSSLVAGYFTSNQYLDVPINSSYAAAYAPWAFMELDSTTTNKWMPPSYVFLHTLALSISSGNKLWFPPAGVRRATVGQIVKTEYNVGSALLDEWQNSTPQFINPIMRLRQYGYVIYGQRTLYRSVDGSIDNRSALQELGVRITANEIKRDIVNVATSMTFEQNNIRTWNEFRGALDPYLFEMKSDGALYDYEIIMDETTTASTDIDQNRIVGVVRANITRAAEDFEIGFELTASSVSFSEE